MLNQSIETARTQRAKGLELRAATTLAEAFVRDQRLTDARAVLAPIVNSFDPATHNIDVRRAREVLLAV